MHFDDVLVKYVGQFGRYQAVRCALLACEAFTNAFITMEIIFVALTPNFWCDVTPFSVTDSGVAAFNDSVSLVLGNNTGFQNTSDGLSGMSCRLPAAITHHPSAGDNGTANWNLSTLSCDRWQYDTSIYQQTIVTKWDFVCDKSWLVGLAFSINGAGSLAGVFIGGLLSDRFGRRQVFLGTTVLTVIVRVVMAVSPWSALYLAMRFMMGATGVVRYGAAFVLGTELVGPRWRVHFATVMAAMYSLGVMVLPLLAFLAPHWKTLTWVVTAIYATSLLYFFVLQESPRWLYAVGRTQEADAILEEMARRNKTSLPADLLVHVTEEKEKSQTTWRDFVRSGIVVRRMLMSAYLWFAVSFVYYGISLDVGSLAGSIYLNTFAMGAVELIGYISCLPLVGSRLGRRYSNVLLMAACSLSFLLRVAIPPGIGRTVLAIVGKLLVSAAFNLVYIYTSELFPTGMRNSALGTASTAARIGSTTAPFVSQLRQTSWLLPVLTFGLCSLLAAATTMGLPETRGRPLPSNVDDVTKMQSEITCHCVSMRKAVPSDDPAEA